MSAPLSTKEVIFEQRILKASGLYKGSKIDGDWGPKTEAAHAEFTRQAHALEAQFGSFDARTEKNILTLALPAQRIARRFMQHALKLVPEGWTVRIISGTRTYEQQDALYAQGRTTPGPRVTNARGGQSNHNFGLAWDIGIFDNSGRYVTQTYQYEALGPKIMGLDLYPIEWGGNWKSLKDYPHYEYGTGLNLTTRRRRFEDGTLLLTK